MTSGQSFEVTPDTKIRRYKHRAVYDRKIINEILAEGLTCHVAFIADLQPVCIPTAYAKIDDKLYIHGSIASRMLKSLKGGVDICITVTLLDGLVLARSGYHHDMNYRSVTAFGKAMPVTDEAEREQALGAFVDHIIPGRNAQIRQPTTKEVRATSLLALTLDKVSAKVATGGPEDEEEDYDLPIWAGNLPMHPTGVGSPVPDPKLPAGIDVPANVAQYRRPTSR